MDALILIHRDLAYSGPFIKIATHVNVETGIESREVLVADLFTLETAKCVCGNCSINDLIEIAANKIINISYDEQNECLRKNIY